MIGGRWTGGLLCLAVLITILSLGLWPFHVPRNDVAWLPNRPGLRFGGEGTAIGSGLPPSRGPGGEPAGGVEVWLRPGHALNSGTFLAFHSPDHHTQLLMRQSETDLELQTREDGRWRGRTARLYVNDVFKGARPVFITAAAGAQGTSIYVNGVLVKHTMRFRLSGAHFAGRLIAGDAPGQSDAWLGRLFGLAVFRGELRPEQAARHYLTWTREGRPALDGNGRYVALYLFDERKGNVAHNAAGPGFDLRIPPKYEVVDKIFLEPFWQEFGFSWSYWSAALKNIIGFVPLGFCFYAWLAGLRLKRAAPVTVLLGTAVSITIEVLQAYLPTRDSGTTDIFTNTLGTWLGVVSYNIAVPILAEIRLRVANAPEQARAGR